MNTVLVFAVLCVLLSLGLQPFAYARQLEASSAIDVVSNQIDDQSTETGHSEHELVTREIIKGIVGASKEEEEVARLSVEGEAARQAEKEEEAAQLNSITSAPYINTPISSNHMNIYSESAPSAELVADIEAEIIAETKAASEVENLSEPEIIGVIAPSSPIDRQSEAEEIDSLIETEAPGGWNEPSSALLDPQVPKPTPEFVIESTTSLQIEGDHLEAAKHAVEMATEVATDMESMADGEYYRDYIDELNNPQNETTTTNLVPEVGDEVEAEGKMPRTIDPYVVKDVLDSLSANQDIQHSEESTVELGISENDNIEATVNETSGYQNEVNGQHISHIEDIGQEPDLALLEPSVELFYGHEVTEQEENAPHPSTIADPATSSLTTASKPPTPTISEGEDKIPETIDPSLLSYVRDPTSVNHHVTQSVEDISPQKGDEYVTESQPFAGNITIVEEGDQSVPVALIDPMDSSSNLVWLAPTKEPTAPQSNNVDDAIDTTGNYVWLAPTEEPSHAGHNYTASVTLRLGKLTDYLDDSQITVLEGAAIKFVEDTMVVREEVRVKIEKATILSQNLDDSDGQLLIELEIAGQVYPEPSSSFSFSATVLRGFVLEFDDFTNLVYGNLALLRKEYTTIVTLHLPEQTTLMNEVQVNMFEETTKDFVINTMWRGGVDTMVDSDGIEVFIARVQVINQALGDNGDALAVSVLITGSVYPDDPPETFSFTQNVLYGFAMNFSDLTDTINAIEDFNGVDKEEPKEMVLAPDPRTTAGPTASPTQIEKEESSTVTLKLPGRNYEMDIAQQIIFENTAKAFVTNTVRRDHGVDVEITRTNVVAQAVTFDGDLLVEINIHGRVAPSPDETVVPDSFSFSSAVMNGFAFKYADFTSALYENVDFVGPTSSPTSAPTASPTSNPTTSPTLKPTSAPTSTPTLSPSLRPTASPTLAPSLNPTSHPTISPTSNPTPSTRVYTTGVYIRLVGISSTMDAPRQAFFEEEARKFVAKSMVVMDGVEVQIIDAKVATQSVTTTFGSMVPEEDLKGDLLVKLDVTGEVSPYNPPGDFHFPSFVLAGFVKSFSDLEDALYESSDFFEPLGHTSIPKSDPEMSDEGSNNSAIIVGAAIAAISVLLSVGTVVVKRNSNPKEDASLGSLSSSGLGSYDMPVTSLASLPFSPKSPNTMESGSRRQVWNYRQSMSPDIQATSIGYSTSDYGIDSANNSVGDKSSKWRDLGLTFSSDSQFRSKQGLGSPEGTFDQSKGAESQSGTRSSQKSADGDSRYPMSVGNLYGENSPPSARSESQSQYKDGPPSPVINVDGELQQGSTKYLRRELFDCYAPPGPLGIVIETTPEGPMVHSLKPESKLASLIHTGDLVVGLDDLDTRGMTAATLTRLMAKRTQQPQRKITLLSARPSSP